MHTHKNKQANKTHRNALVHLNIFSQFWEAKVQHQFHWVEIRMSNVCRAVLHPESLGENPLLASSSFWWLMAFLCLCPLHYYLCLHFHTAFSSSCITPLILALTMSLVVISRTFRIIEANLISKHLQVLGIRMIFEWLLFIAEDIIIIIIIIF